MQTTTNFVASTRIHTIGGGRGASGGCCDHDAFDIYVALVERRGRRPVRLRIRQRARATRVL